MDTPPGNVPADILDVYPSSYFNKSYMWPGLKAHWRNKDNSPSTGFDQARIMGGGSSVMGMVALRGIADDYDEWERRGAAGWGWKDVLPYFRKLETDLDFRGDLHGDAGPVPIRRVKREDWPPLARGALEFSLSRKLPFIADMNADFRDGYCAQPMSNTPQQRASAASCYLDADVRRRANLTIIASANVCGLVFEDRRVIGVRAAVDGEEKDFRAREVILCAGGVLSSALLLRSGIGPADHLRALGIEVRADRPGVGRNLQNHPAVFIGAQLHPAARQSDSLRTLQISCFRLSSGLPDCPQTDLLVNLQSRSSWNATGRQIANLSPVLWKPFSRGRVSLLSRHPAQYPLVEFNFLADDRDLRRLMYGFRFAVELLSFEAVKGLIGRPFPVRFTDRLRRLNQLTKSNAVKASFIAAFLNLNPKLSDYALAALTGGVVDLGALSGDDARLAEHLRKNVAGTFHVSGTCRIGSADDPDAVVDTSGRVHRVGGLRVADASVMPLVPRGNTNVPVIMVAEKLAAAMLHDEHPN